MKYLIVNADDYGMCRSANLAVQELFDLGFLRSATLEVPCPTAEEAAVYAAAHPEHAIGVHLTLTSEWPHYAWKPLTDGVSLRNAEGYMWQNIRLVEENARWEDIEPELQAQLDQARAWGLNPSHLDNHMGSLYGTETGRVMLAKKALEFSHKNNLPYRMYTRRSDIIRHPDMKPLFYHGYSLLVAHWVRKYKVITPDYLYLPQWTDEMRISYEVYRENILNQWCSLPEGITETYVHPSLDTEEIRNITGRWQDRVWEYQLMKDPETHRRLETAGVKLISYRDLVKLRGKQC